MIYKKVISIVLSTAILLCLCSCSISKSTSIAVIVKSKGSYFWQSVYSGLNTAASEYNMKFTFDAPESEEDYEYQNVLIEQAISRNVGVIVFSAIDYNKSVSLIEKAYDKGIHIIIVDSDINSKKVDVRIGTDNNLAGESAAKAALDAVEGSIKAGIVNFDKNSQNGQLREEGFKNAALESGRIEIKEVINVQSNIDDALAGTKELISRHSDMNLIVTFNEYTSLGVGNAIKELGLLDKIDVVAFDNNLTSVSMLETGEIDALIVQNPFAMGYFSIEYAEKLLKNKKVKENLNTDTTIINKENMYDPGNQKILFLF